MELLLNKRAQEMGEKQYADMKEDISVYRPRSGTANESKRCCYVLIRQWMTAVQRSRFLVSAHWVLVFHKAAHQRKGNAMFTESKPLPRPPKLKAD